ncbi:MAG: hypothetical protein RIS24_502 [Verrucomicrobiota bacterium]
MPLAAQRFKSEKSTNCRESARALVLMSLGTSEGLMVGCQNCLLGHLTSSMIVVSDLVIGTRLAPSVCVTPGS